MRDDLSETITSAAFIAVLVLIAFSAAFLGNNSVTQHEMTQNANPAGSYRSGTDHEQNEPWWDDAVADFTLALVIVGGLQAVLFFWQLRLIRESLIDTKESADAAKDAANTASRQANISTKTLETMQDTARRQLRAYVSVYPSGLALEVNDVAIKIIQVFARVKNHGQTPAQEVSFIFKGDLVPNPLPNDFIFPPAATRIDDLFAIPPAEEVNSWFNLNRFITSDELTALAGNTLYLGLWGAMFYRDVFDEIRQTKIICFLEGSQIAAAVESGRRSETGPPIQFKWGQRHNEGNYSE